MPKVWPKRGKKYIKLSENILWKHTLYDFNSIQFVETCLMDQDMVSLDKCPTELEKKNVYSAVVG